MFSIRSLTQNINNSETKLLRWFTSICTVKLPNDKEKEFVMPFNV